MNFKRRSGIFLVWTIGILLLLFSNGFYPDTAQAEVIIIANPSVSVDGITKDNLKKIFSGQQVVWGDGQPVRPAILEDGEIHKEFVSGYLDKTPNQFQTYWRKMVFTGQGIQPRTFGSEEELIDYVAKTAGAVGYISSSSEAAKTKTLQVEKN